MRRILTPPRPKVQSMLPSILGETAEEITRERNTFRELARRRRAILDRPEFTPEPDHDATIAAVPRPMFRGGR